MLPCGWLPLDVDTFAMDNGGTRKEGVDRTYAGVDGYCPLAAYLDHPDCKALKAGLMARCQGTHRQAHGIVRVACTELETLCLADLAAVAQGLHMPALAKHQANKKFHNPDQLGSPNRELQALTRRRNEKLAGSRAIGRHLSLENTRSSSFRNLVMGIRRLSADLLQA